MEWRLSEGCPPHEVKGECRYHRSRSEKSIGDPLPPGGSDDCGIFLPLRSWTEKHSIFREGAGVVPLVDSGEGGPVDSWIDEENIFGWSKQRDKWCTSKTWLDDIAGTPTTEEGPKLERGISLSGPRLLFTDPQRH